MLVKATEWWSAEVELSVVLGAQLATSQDVYQWGLIWRRCLVEEIHALVTSSHVVGQLVAIMAGAEREVAV